MKIIELSYDHLPDQLKPCFLYLASLQKDSSITIYELKILWHVEGLVEPTKMKSVEEVMDFYLDTLISSSLVILFNEIDLSPCQMTINYHREHFGLNFVLIDTKSKRHSGKHLYSLMITRDELDDCLSDTCHLRHLRLLRVLILESSFIMVKDYLLNEIFKALPSSFSNLFNLETLIVENKEPPLVLLPRIWTLLKLRVLSIKAGSFFDFDVDESILTTKDTRLEKLRFLEKLVLTYSKATFPNLQQLSFSLKESWDCSTERYWFLKLDFLNELESLKVELESPNTNENGPSIATHCPWDFHF
ncbi:hypothetical protein R3W88_014737 [Solanum pinnatisectum]|uniref:Uncharacterized protein n=1 Tax=Solanum pinnatisectum TaxID=50273 RepID=A0AAV9KST9_9SOLN|nr:hypothetical protein R3W88_014737 [Solanum pinnatisectum]